MFNCHRSKEKTKRSVDEPSRSCHPQHLCGPDLHSCVSVATATSAFTFWDSQPHFYISPQLSSDSLHVGPWRVEFMALINLRMSGEGVIDGKHSLPHWLCQAENEATGQKVTSKQLIPQVHVYSWYNKADAHYYAVFDHESWMSLWIGARSRPVQDHGHMLSCHVTMRSFL